ncbi:MAG: hypothetical protein ABR924_06125 [Terracidiphilus sp.]|jgi:K+-sensing histidine kinase KdpD
MKIPSLDLELKVLLTVVGICVFGVLRMTHVIHLSETDDISLLFLLGAILSGLVFRSARYYSAGNAMFYLCFGLAVWEPMKPTASILVNCLEGFFLVFIGLCVVAFAAAAFQDYRKAKRKGTPELQVKE